MLTTLNRVTKLYLFLALAFAALVVLPALASQPVPRVMVGCVTDGAFISSDGYHIQPHRSGGTAVDLSRYEGRRLRIKGNLLPGDVLILNARPEDLGPCGD